MLDRPKLGCLAARGVLRVAPIYAARSPAVTPVVVIPAAIRVVATHALAAIRAPAVLRPAARRVFRSAAASKLAGGLSVDECAAARLVLVGGCRMTYCLKRPARRPSYAQRAG